MMTPELKVACEVVFQEHKTPHHSVTWNRDAFLGRLSTGLTEMAKDTLLRKKIIYYPNPNKKMVTLLSPQAEYASTFEEAERMVTNPVAVMLPAAETEKRTTAVADRSSTYVSVKRPVITQRVVATRAVPEVVAVSDVKWYMKPVFYYFVWPVGAAVAGIIIAHYMGELYTSLFFDLKK